MRQDQDQPNARRETQASTAAVCRQLCQLSTAVPPDLSAIAQLAQQSDVIAASLLRCANSPRFALVKPITSLRHAVIFLGAAEVRRVAENSLLRFDQPHAAPAALVRAAPHSNRNNSSERPQRKPA